MMELSALGVREGDSFLLEYEDTIAGKTKRILYCVGEKKNYFSIR